MKISIIVPVYKVEKYIERCIVSLLDQDLDDYEIIVVDDGTPDRSIDIIEKRWPDERKIKIVHQANKGLSAARNKGILEACGDYIVFVDSDDALREKSLGTLCEIISDNVLDILIYDLQDFMENDESHGKTYEARKIVEDKVLTGPVLFEKLIKTGAYTPSACGYIINKNILEEKFLRFKEGILHEDVLFTPILLQNCKRSMYVHQSIYYRYVRLGSITMSDDNVEQRMQGLYTAITELFDYYDEKMSSGVDDWAFVRNILNMSSHFVGELTRLRLNKHYCEEIKDVNGRVKKHGWKYGPFFQLYLIKMKTMNRLLR